MNYDIAGVDVDIDKLQALAPKFVSMLKFPVGCKVLYNLRCSNEAKLMQAKSTQVEEVFMHFENGRRVYKVKVTPETSDAREMYFYEDQLVYGIGSPVRVSKLGTNKTLDGVVLFSEREKGTDGVQKVIYTVQYSDSGENDITIESRIIADRIKFRAKGIDGNESTSITNKQTQPICSQEGDVNLEGKEAENSPYFSAAKSCSNSEYSDHNSHDTTNRDQVFARKRSCVYYDVEHAKVPKREVRCGAKGELKAENTASVKGLSYDYNSESGESRNYVDYDSNAEESQKQQGRRDCVPESPGDVLCHHILSNMAANSNSDAGNTSGQTPSSASSRNPKRKKSSDDDVNETMFTRLKRKKCSMPDCNNIARQGGVCARHGAKMKNCTMPDCNNNATQGGVCIRHGAKRKKCSMPDCNNDAKQGGVCVRHGAKIRKCSMLDCNNDAKQGGVCIRHGAKRKKCSMPDCNNNATQGGVCVRHGAKVRKCSMPDCNNIVKQGGVCIRHGAKMKK